MEKKYEKMLGNGIRLLPSSSFFEPQISNGDGELKVCADLKLDNTEMVANLKKLIEQKLAEKN